MRKIRGTVSQVITQKSNGWGVFSVAYDLPNGNRSSVKMTGVANDLRAGDIFVATGEWETRTWTDRYDNARSEEQFKFKNIVPDLPANLTELRPFLLGSFNAAQHGLNSTAIDDMIRRHGDRLLEVLKRDPKPLVEASSNPALFRSAIQNEWSNVYSTRRAIALMRSAGLQESTIRRITSAFRDRTLQTLESDPYAISMLDDLSFEDGDKLGQSLGIGEDDSRRISSAVYDAVRRKTAGQGHTYVSAYDVAAQAAKNAGVDEQDILSYTTEALEKGHPTLHVETQNGDLVISTRWLARAEIKCANRIADLLMHGRKNSEGRVATLAERVCAGSRLPFDSIQRSAIEMSAVEPMSIITGGPGTGKSQIQAAVVSIAHLMGERIYIAAPTGTAAARLTDAVSGAEIDLKGTTVHRKLESIPDPATGGHKFRRNKDNPLENGCLVVIDESSMLDVQLMAAVMDALPEDGRLLLVGDRYQLPSVGAGAVLRDLISSGEVPIVELEHVYRTSDQSAIPEGAAAIKNGDVPYRLLSGRKIQNGLGFFECDPRDIESSISTLIGRHLTQAGYDIHNDVCVLSPQRKGVAGVNDINRRLSGMLNPGGEALHEVSGDAPPIRIGDRVMYRENDVERDVFNGDTGTLIEARRGGKNTMSILFDNGVTHTFPLAVAEKFDVSFATTIHKSQGHQHKVVIMPVTTKHSRMLERSLLYTGWTRAQEVLILVGEKRALEMAVENTRSQDRRTRLENMLVSRMESHRELVFRDEPKEALGPAA